MDHPANRKSPLSSSLFAGILLLFIPKIALPCDLIHGYFYQVTSLRGTVVGVDRNDPRHMSEWFRHRTKRRHLSMKLMPYGLSAEQERKNSPIKIVESNPSGNFDFGPLHTGHYELLIDTGWEDWGTDRYDVEVVSGPKPNKSVLIDVSPINPDCTGGHQFFAFAD